MINSYFSAATPCITSTESLSNVRFPCCVVHIHFQEQICYLTQGKGPIATSGMGLTCQNWSASTSRDESQRTTCDKWSTRSHVEKAARCNDMLRWHEVTSNFKSCSSFRRLIQDC